MRFLVGNMRRIVYTWYALPMQRAQKQAIAAKKSTQKAKLEIWPLVIL